MEREGAAVRCDGRLEVGQNVDQGLLMSETCICIQNYE